MSLIFIPKGVICAPPAAAAGSGKRRGAASGRGELAGPVGQVIRRQRFAQFCATGMPRALGPALCLLCLSAQSHGRRPIMTKPGRHRPLPVLLAAGLTAALPVAVSLPGTASASTGWQVVWRRHFTTSSAYNYLGSVVAPTQSQAWALGGLNAAEFKAGAPLAVHWNGTKWAAVSLPRTTGGGLSAASAPKADDVWAVSSLGGYALRWNGSKWSVAKEWPESNSLPSELTGVTAFSPTDVWVFGGSGAYPGLGTWHLHGTTWTQVTGVGSNLATASALSPTSMWAIGGVNGSYNAVFHYNGTAWRQLTGSALSGLGFQSILAMSATDIWLSATVGGDGAKPELLHFTGGRWHVVTMPWKLLLAGLTADGHGGFWAAGASVTSTATWAVHLAKSGAWSRHKFTSGGPAAFAHIPGAVAASVWGAGATPAGTGAAATIWRH